MTGQNGNTHIGRLSGANAPHSNQHPDFWRQILASNRNMRFTVFAAPALFAVTLLSCAFGQEAPSPTGPPPKSNAPDTTVQTGDPLQTLKIGVNIVNLYFSARDKSGYITNLRKDDCDLAEDKVPQTIKAFTQEKNLPLTIGILMDTSGSQENVLSLEKQSGAEFLKDVLTPKDEAFVISFDINIDLLADYTNSARELRAWWER